MSKKLCFLTFFVLVLFLVPATYGIVVGDWEHSQDGWVPTSWTGETTFSYRGTGATLKNTSVRVQPPVPDWNYIWTLSMMEEPLLSILKENNCFSVNVTWLDDEWMAAGWTQAEALVINGDGIGWNQYGKETIIQDTGNPGSPGTALLGSGTYTTRVTWDYSDIDMDELAEVPTYLDLQLVVMGGSPVGGYYFDNAQFYNSVDAHHPVPSDTQIHVDIETDLSWEAGDYALYHDVYFGTSYAEVDAADNSGAPSATGVYRARTDIGLEFYNIPETLEIGKTYYWRVDEVNDACAPCLWKKEIWSFTTRCQASGPSPADYATNVQRTSLELSWTPGFPGAEHDVYFGTSFEEVNEADDGDVSGIYRGHQDADDSNYAVPETLKTDQTYFWRIDEANDPCGLFFGGDVWRFSTITAKAQTPYPFDGATGIYINAIKLIWTAGPFAASHDVYFGTDYNDVLNADDDDTTGIFRGNHTATEYPLNNLDLETTYYWRIDEVNTSYPDVNWPGDLWSFTIPDYITIDDFEYYTVSDPEGNAACPYYDSNDLRLDQGNDMRYWWLDGHVQKNPQGDCGGTTASYNPLALEGSTGRLPGSRIIRAAGQTGFGMSYFYDNDDVNNADFPPEQAATENKYSEVLRYYTNPVDLTPSQVNANILALELYYRGNSVNAANPVYDRMYIGLRDTNNKYAYVNHPDPAAAQIGTWQQWAVKLSDFTDKEPALNLNSIRSVRIGFGKQGNKYNVPPEQQGGEGTVIFDDIRLFEQRCVRSEGPVGDISGPEYVPDCVVDLWDLSGLVTDWLLADETLEYETVVEPDAPVLWYRFEEVGGAAVKNWAPDYDPNVASDFNGTAENVGDYTWDTTGGRDGNGCINMLAGSQTFIYAPPESLNFAATTQEITFAAWINCDRYTPQDNWNGLFGIREPEDIEVVEVHCPTPSPPDFEFGPSAEWRVYEDWCSYGAPMNIADFSGRWNHYAFTKDAEADVMRLYHNGQLLAEVNDVNAAEPMFGTVETFYIGTRHLWWGWFIGKVDDFQVYDYALSPEEIAYLATDGTGSLFVPLETPSDLHTSDPNEIDFSDYAVLAEHWLEKKLWPQP